MSSVYLRSDRTGPKINTVNGVLVMGEPVEVMRLAGPVRVDVVRVIAGNARDAVAEYRKRLDGRRLAGKADQVELTLDTLHLSQLGGPGLLHVALLLHRSKIAYSPLVSHQVAVGQTFRLEQPEIVIPQGMFARLVLDSRAAMLADVQVTYEELSHRESL